MTTRDQLIRARLGILTMAAEFKNIAKACKLAGVSRSQFYAMKRAYDLHGKEGLAPRIRRKPVMPNRTLSMAVGSDGAPVTTINGISGQLLRPSRNNSNTLRRVGSESALKTKFIDRHLANRLNDVKGRAC